MKKRSVKKKEPLSKKAGVVRVSTGIQNFDSLIEGGFEKDSTNLLVGGSGAGKSIFATQFLIDGVNKGEKCLFITFEEKKEQFFQNMEEFGWDLGKYEKDGSFVFLEYSPAKVKAMLDEGGGEIESIILKNKISRLVIDSITSFELLFEDELQKREASLDLFNMIKKWNSTSLVTFEGSPDVEHKVYKALEFESDSIILMQFIRKTIIRERYIEVLKMRGTAHSKGLYKFSITKKGIEVNNKLVKSKKGD